MNAVNILSTRLLGLGQYEKIRQVYAPHIIIYKAHIFCLSGMQHGLYQNKNPGSSQNNTEHVETQPSVTLAAGCSGASFSLCLEQENASSSGGVVAENLSQISEVVGMDDLTLAAA